MTGNNRPSHTITLLLFSIPVLWLKVCIEVCNNMFVVKYSIGVDNYEIKAHKIVSQIHCPTNRYIVSRIHHCTGDANQ